MVTIGNKRFPVGVACGSRHKGFITSQGSRAPGASGGLDSPVRKGLFGVTHSVTIHRRQHRWASPGRGEEDGAMGKNYDYKAQLGPEKIFLCVWLLCPETSVPSH